MTKNISITTLQRPIDVSNLKIEAPFVCMVYLNQDTTKEEMILVANWLISSGCRYVVCGGNNCELLHDIIDETSVIKNIDENKDELVMTTGHENEPVEEVVWFWLNLTNFDDINFENYLALVIGESKEIEEEIHQRIKENSL